MRPQWTAAVASAIILGLLVGIPYYSMPFFYDYFEHRYRWSRAQSLLGLPLATLITLLAGPLVARRLAPRAAVLAGTVLCAAAIAGFGRTGGSLTLYYLAWTLYMAGWTMAGPMTHQLLLARIFQKDRGSGLALSFFGISLFGAFSVAAVARPLTAAFGLEQAFLWMGALLLLAIPIAWWGWPNLPPPPAPPAKTSLRKSRDFWLLLTGTCMTAAGIAGVTQHLKLILRERAGWPQAQLDEIFGWTLLCLLLAGAAGRFTFAWCLDRFPRRRVISVAFLCMLAAMPLLYRAQWPYLFGLLFGAGMSTDSLLLTLLAAERFPGAQLAAAMAILVPVSTVSQTWFPYAVSLLWQGTGSYTLPLGLVFALIAGGRILLLLLPETPHAESV